jgi:serine/threonine protein kinase/Tol biopolymer transport system component
MRELNLIGKSLGQYQILEELGQGGMAVVYKAWQASLRRYVAIKVMLPHLLTDREFVQRFQQEAIVAANLNHSNIVTIYEVAQHEGYFFIVMEYVEGQSLEQMIVSEGALSLERSVNILRQVADALDFAHQRQFVHRDIKPANILLTPEKKAVISDFGIAKALKGSGATANLTATGTIIGSPAYMSPEQIIGQDMDYRTDLYSLGVVAYEMFSGRAPFGGATTAILYAQVNTPPPRIGEIQPDLPPHVEMALSRMLVKQPSERYSTAKAFVEVLAGQQQPSVGPAPPLQKTSVMPPEAVDSYAQRGAMAGVNTGGYSPPAASQSGAASPSNFSGWSKNVNPPLNAVSRPKRKSAVWWLLGGGFLLVLLAFLGVLVFWVGPSVFDGWPIGQEEEVAGSQAVDRNRIAFVSERDGNADIYVMNPDGTGLRPLTRGGSSDYYPRWSPDGCQIISHSYPPEIQAGEGDAQLFLIDVETGDRTLVEAAVSNAKFADWAPDGERIVFSGEQDGNWDLYIFNLTTEGLRRLTQGQNNDYFPAWSPDGMEVAFVRDNGDDRDIFIVSADGLDVQNITNRAGWDWQPSWSPDAQEIAFAAFHDDSYEIFVMRADGGNVRQLTDMPGVNNTEPRWSPDAQRIVFVSTPDGDAEIYVMDADGTSLVRLTNVEQADYNPHWR